jgi:hypothetical protein
VTVEGTVSGTLYGSLVGAQPNSRSCWEQLCACIWDNDFPLYSSLWEKAKTVFPSLSCLSTKFPVRQLKPAAVTTEGCDTLLEAL